MESLNNLKILNYTEDFKLYISNLYKGKPVAWTQDPKQKEIIGKKISEAKKNDPKNKIKNCKKYKIYYETGEVEEILGLVSFSNENRHSANLLRDLIKGNREKYKNIIKIEEII